MLIRPVDVHHGSEFHAFQIHEASRRFERPLAVLWTEHEAAVSFPTPDDSEDQNYLTVDVAPRTRSRGLGTVLVDHVLSRADATTGWPPAGAQGRVARPRAAGLWSIPGSRCRGCSTNRADRRRDPAEP